MVQNMANASNEWRMLVRFQKPREIHLQQRKQAEHEDFRCSSQENVSENALTLFSHPRVKSGLPTISSLCFILVINPSIIGTRTLRTSAHTLRMLPKTFSQGIGMEASSLEGELWCDPQRSTRWSMLPTSGERSFGVRNHWKSTCSEGNRLSSRTSSVRPKKTRAIMPQTQFSHYRVKSGLLTVSSFYFVLVISPSIFGARTPRNSTHSPGMLTDTFSQGIGPKASSLEGELWWTQNGPKDD